ncbi:MAG: FeoB-associated Cys-rich membrane protein [Sphaerochaetaceae bacterium]|jgi:hypothetical protein|nr:FeoB-associated Cys-rich membrane protein [Sphaerochaetaceae bacterium]MDY0371780.1 FeoB-associated Cys-rich membrane protein [Sphaerochaetaceae bacterium]
MANIIVGSIVFGILAFIIIKTIRVKRTTGGLCQMSCKTCPYACDKQD